MALTDLDADKLDTANIPGISAAEVNSQASPLALGNRGCGFFLMSETVLAEKKNSFDSHRYILTESGLYYFNNQTLKLKF